MKPPIPKPPHSLLLPNPNLLSHELSLSSQILSILHTLPPSSPLEPSLDLLLPSLTPHTISSVLQSSPPFQPSFRLFIWASRFKRLRSWHSHNLIISSLLRNLSPAWDSLADLNNSRLPIPPQAFSALISAYSAAGSPENAVAAFARMPDFRSRPNTFTYNTLLEVLVRQDMLLLAMAVYNVMIKSDCRPNRATFTILIHAHCRAGKNRDALRLLDEMTQRGIRPNTMVYTVFLSFLCGENRIDDASRLFDSMRRNVDFMPDSVAYGVMLSGFCKAGRLSEGFALARLFEDEGFVLGVRGYSSLIDGLFRAKKFEEACRVYREMLGKNVDPDCGLYTVMIRGYLGAGRVEDAFGFLSEMTKRGLVPDTSCYNTLIKGLCDVGWLDRARSLQLEISQHGLFPDSGTYTIMICGLCKEGLVLEAQQIFDEMGKFGCAPSIMTFNSLISGLCKAGKLKEAHILFYKMEMGGKPSVFLRLSQGAYQVRDSDSLRKLVEELCQAGLVDKAYMLLRDIIDSGVVPDVVTYNILINNWFKVGKPDKALNLFKELHAKGYSPDAVTYATVINGLFKVSREEDAWKMFQHMLRTRCSPNSSVYNVLMKAMCRKEKVLRAVRLWLYHISQGITSPEEVETIKVVRTHFEKGYVEDAVRGLVAMDRRRGSVNSSPYTIWVIGYCQARKVDDALKIFNVLEELDIDATTPTCAFLIYKLCSEGKLASALDVMFYALRKRFLFMQPVGNRLIKKLCKGNMRKDAHDLVQRMSLAGYDMDNYLWVSTKHLLYSQMTGDG